MRVLLGFAAIGFGIYMASIGLGHKTLSQADLYGWILAGGLGWIWFGALGLLFTSFTNKVRGR